MNAAGRVLNIKFAGLGGMGVLKATDILADVAFRAGYDVKKAEVHGMSQRGGGIDSDVRFGPKVHSPMIPEGEADLLVIMEETQLEVHRHQLRDGGTLILPSAIDREKLPHPKSLNIALLGALSRHLAFPPADWMAALRRFLPEKTLTMNEQAFALGRGAGVEHEAEHPTGGTI